MKDRNYFAKFQNFQKNVSTEFEFSSQDFISLETGLQCICSNFLSLQCAIGKSIFCLLSGHGLYKANHPDNGRFTECLRTIYLYIYLFLLIYIFIYLYICLYIFIYLSICLYMLIYIYISIYMPLLINIYISIYMLIYIYISIYMLIYISYRRRVKTEEKAQIVAAVWWYFPPG